MQHRKYFQMAGVAAFGLFLYYVLKRVSPNRQQELLRLSNEYIKYVPLDRNMSFINPILDMTSAATGAGLSAAGSIWGGPRIDRRAQKIMTSGGRGGVAMSAAPVAATAEIGGGGGAAQKFKRSVSETKKKYVASLTGWKCSSCGSTLDFSYEIDHIVPLGRGGDNSVSNLTPLCVSCHKKKTLMEYL
jgi:hypothetical protein